MYSFADLLGPNYEPYVNKFERVQFSGVVGPKDYESVAMETHIPKGRIPLRFVKPTDKPFVEKISEVVTEQLSTVSSVLGNAPVLKWTDKSRVLQISGGVVTAFGYLYQIGESLVSSLSRGAAIVEVPTFELPEILHKIAIVAGNCLKYIKIAFLGTSLIALGFAINNTRKIIVGSVNDKIDAAIDLFRNLSDIGFGLSISVQGLCEAGKIANGILHFIPGLNIISAVLSGATIFRSVKNSIQSQAVADMMQAGMARNSSEDNRALLNEFIEKDDAFLKKHFGSDARALREQLKTAQKYSDLLMHEGDDEKSYMDRNDGHQIVEKSLNNMKLRIGHQVWADKMTIIASITSLIGLLILAVPPLAPFALIGFILLAVSALTYTGLVIHDSISRSQFEKSMNMAELDNAEKVASDPIEDPNSDNARRHREWAEKITEEKLAAQAHREREQLSRLLDNVN